MLGVFKGKLAEPKEPQQEESKCGSTLAEKVAADFKRPVLVEPDTAFAPSESQMMMFGGLLPGQKFTYDKRVHVNTKAIASQLDGVDTYKWYSPRKLNQSTEIAVLSQKGQKSASDPTPNQDNYFIHHFGDISFYGVCDGHGPFGHLVSFRLVQTLPYFLVKSAHFGKDWALALKEAFLESQRALVEFCKREDVNIE